MSNTVKLIVDKSTKDAIRPGRIISFDITESDLTAPVSTPADDYMTLHARVIMGNKQYRTGQKVTLYIKFDLTHLPS